VADRSPPVVKGWTVNVRTDKLTGHGGRRMIRGLIGLALGWCLIVGANAQPLADVATDQELFAAYCLGVIIAAESDGSLSETETLLGRDAAAQQEKEHYSRKRSQFHGYLMARGLLSGSRSTAVMRGARLANERGRADTPRCSAKVRACIEKYSFRKMDDLKLVENCRDEEDACRKTARCYNDARLPF
jgi:hypothetical protein